MIYFGFDLGDGESCVSWSRDLSIHEPMPVAVNGSMSFPSAVGYADGEVVIGDHASGSASVEDLRVCFKRHFLENKPEVDATIIRFVKGVLDVLRQNKEINELISDPEKHCFIVGCPAGWSREERERYRGLLKEAGMLNVRIASESRAAFENALRCNKDAEETELIKESVLVIDIGSSTLDLAYVCDGEEHNVEVVGDVKLGGGLMDEMIVLHALDSMENKEKAQELKAFLDTHPGWYSRVMYKARELKEQYFNNEDYYFDNNEELMAPVKIFDDGKAFKLPLRLSPEVVEGYVISQPHPLLDKQSFESKLKNMLKTVHQQLLSREGDDRKAKEPKAVLLTGGPSRMKFFQDMCKNEFKQSRVIISREPEFDISRGLSYAGNVDENAAHMLKDIRKYIAGSEVEKKVTERVPDLIDALSVKLGDAIIYKCVVPAFREWKESDVSDTLEDLKDDITAETDQFMQGEQGKKLIADVCTPWTQELMASVQKDLDDIATQHKVNLSKLKSGNVVVNSGDDVGIDPAMGMSKLVGAIVTLVAGIIMAMVCGGADTALIMTGPIGIVIAVIITIGAYVLGKEKLEGVIMTIPFPKLMRKLFPEKSITKEENLDKVIASIHESMTGNTELVSSLTGQVSQMIDKSLSEMILDSESQIVA